LKVRPRGIISTSAAAAISLAQNWYWFWHFKLLSILVLVVVGWAPLRSLQVRALKNLCWMLVVSRPTSMRLDGNAWATIETLVNGDPFGTFGCCSRRRRRCCCGGDCLERMMMASMVAQCLKTPWKRRTMVTSSLEEVAVQLVRRLPGRSCFAQERRQKGRSCKL
jgi:hypothetical protein